MKLTISIALLAATLASAQASGQPTLPQCALTCALNNISKSTCGTDQKCLCLDTTYQAAFLQCVMAGCSPAEQQTTGQVGTALCASLGVNASPPPAQSSSAASAATTVGPVTTSMPANHTMNGTMTTSHAGNGTMTATAHPTSYTGAAATFGANAVAGMVALVGAIVL